MTHGSNSVSAIEKSMGVMYGMIQQQAALLSFVEAFWLMGMIFLGMLPLLVFLRDARDLDPRVKRSQVRQRVAPGHEPVPEPEMAGALPLVFTGPSSQEHFSERSETRTDSPVRKRHHLVWAWHSATSVSARLPL